MTNTAPTTALPIRPGRWTLDAAHTSVAFTIKRLGFSKVRGTFADVVTEVVVGATPADTSLVATVALASVDTGNPDRDAHLRSPDLLDVEARPTMVFRSTDISGAGDDWTIDGELAIGDVTAPVSLEVGFLGANDFPADGRVHAGFEAATELRRKDHGLGFGALGAGLGSTIKVDIDVELVEPN